MIPLSDQERLVAELGAAPLDRVHRLSGVESGAVALALSAAGDDRAPVVIRLPERVTSPGDVVGAVLDDLERVATELFPAWLPEAAGIDRPDAGGTAAVRMIAAAHAARARYAPALLTAVAVRSVTGRPQPRPGLPRHVLAAQLARLVADGFGRARCVLLIPAGPEGGERRRELIAAGAGWLTARAGAGAWLVEPPAPGPRPVTAALRGKPHPASRVEALLEAALAAEPWAAGRRWNEPYRSSAFSSGVRLDLLWPDERCVVELDGPEHCRLGQFEADRQRDVHLQLDGYAVLRFTNARVLHDVGAVVHQIGTYLRGRRRDTAEGRTDGRR